jgi:hypothetical protein
MQINAAVQWHLGLLLGLIDLFAVVGTYDRLTAEIEKRYSGCADTISLPQQSNTEFGLLREVIQDIERIPVAFKDYATAW